MRTIKIYCKECETELTPELVEILESDLCWNGKQDIIPKTNFSIFINRKSYKKTIMVAIDNYNLDDHPDIIRFQGCCGSSGMDGLNKLCMNGHEVATEFSDCWTGDYIEFEINNVILKEKIDDVAYKEFKF